MGHPGSIPGSERSPCRKKWQSTPVFLPGESHGWRSPAGYSPRGRKELDMTEQLHFHFIFTTRYIHNCVSFPLWPSCVILSGAIINCPLLFPISILDPSNLGDSSSRVVYFCLFILFMGFSRQEYWSRLPFPSPGDLPDPGIEPRTSDCW